MQFTRKVSWLLLISLLVALILPCAALAESGDAAIPLPDELNGALCRGGTYMDDGRYGVYYEKADRGSLNYLLKIFSFFGYITMRVEDGTADHYVAIHLAADTVAEVYLFEPEAAILVLLDNPDSGVRGDVVEQVITYYTQDLKLPPVPGDYIFPQFYASVGKSNNDLDSGFCTSETSPFGVKCWMEVYSNVNEEQMLRYMSDMLLCGFDVAGPGMQPDDPPILHGDYWFDFTNGDAEVKVNYVQGDHSALVFYKPGISYGLLDGKEYGALPRLNISGFPSAGNSSQSVPKSSVSIGSLVSFGTYVQNEKGKTPVLWAVLDKRDGMVLLLSATGLDTHAFNSKKQRATWAECSLRSWLNSSFLKAAFSSKEQASIRETTISTPAGTYYPPEGSGIPIEGSADTKDKVFLLSVAQVQEYFPKDDQRPAYNTRYLLSKPESELPFPANNDDDFMYGNWWLRDVRSDNGTACVFHVKSYGSIASRGQIQLKRYVIRPAIWVDEDYPFEKIVAP